MKHEIKICMGSSCFARGNTENLEIIERYIKDNHLETKIDLVGSRCEAKCDKGPNIIIDNIEYSCINREKLEEILKEL